MGGWVAGKAGLRIAYSNQKSNLCKNLKVKNTSKDIQMSTCWASFLLPIWVLSRQKMDQPFGYSFVSVMSQPYLQFFGQSLDVGASIPILGIWEGVGNGESNYVLQGVSKHSWITSHNKGQGPMLSTFTDVNFTAKKIYVDYPVICNCFFSWDNWVL
jgi:hypothetical protein